MLKVMVRSIYYCLYAAFGDNLHRLSCVWNNGSSEKNKKPVHDSTQSFYRRTISKRTFGSDCAGGIVRDDKIKRS